MYAVFQQDNLFSIGEDAPGAGVGLTTDTGFEGGVISLDYSQSDQYFATLSIGLGEANWDTFRGSYLFDFGLFVGITGVFEGGDYEALVSPGYRFDLGGDGYVAVGLDYAIASEGSGELYGYEADVKYLGDNCKITGQVYLFDDGDYFAYAKGNYALNDGLVLGGGVLWDDYGSVFFGGLTWKPASFTFDALVSSEEGDLFFFLSGLYEITDSLAVGLECMGGEGDTATRVKAKYAIGDGELAFAYAVSGGPEGLFNLSYGWAL